MIDFNKNKEQLFNPLFHSLQKTQNRYVINYGGAGSSKSYTQTQYEIINCLLRREKLLVVRKVGTTLKDSVIALFTSILNSWGLTHLYEENKATQFLKFTNGSQILFKGMDDPEKIKSIAGITRIWIEEASELTQADFNQLNLRLRGADNLQMTLTFNPIDEDHWIKKHFFDTPNIASKTDIIKTTYLDNKFIDDEYKKVLESYKEIDKNYYNIYALGNWGSISEGRIFPIWETVDMFPPNVPNFWYGLDFGFANDPTAIVKTLHWKDRIYLDEVLYQTGLVNNDIAGFLKDIGYTGELVICDSAEPKSIQELRLNGINAVPADKKPGSIMAGIDYLKKNKILVTARSSNIIKENRYYQWKQDKNGKYINTPKDWMNHAIDAIRYAYSLGGYIRNDSSPFLDYSDL